METPTWSERKRDRLEHRLATEPEIHAENRWGLEIIVYYLRKLGQVSLALTESGQTRKFIIPNDRVNDAITHPEFYAHEAGQPRPISRGYEND